MASVHRKGEVFEFLNFLFFGFFPFDFPLLFFLFRTSSNSSISRLKSPFFVATNEVARKHRPSPDDDDEEEEEAEEKKNQPPFFVVFFV